MLFSKKKRILDSTQGPMTKSMILYALPIILTNVIQYSFNSIDKMIVGRYVGSEALGGVSRLSQILCKVYTRPPR